MTSQGPSILNCRKVTPRSPPKKRSPDSQAPSPKIMPHSEEWCRGESGREWLARRGLAGFTGWTRQVPASHAEHPNAGRCNHCDHQDPEPLLPWGPSICSPVASLRCAAVSPPAPATPVAALSHHVFAAAGIPLIALRMDSGSTSRAISISIFQPADCLTTGNLRHLLATRHKIKIK